MNPTRRQACVLLMQHALASKAETIVAFGSPQTAARWRDSCYRIRQSLAAVGDHRFDALRLTIVGSELHAINKET